MGRKGAYQIKSNINMIGFAGKREAKFKLATKSLHLSITRFTYTEKRGQYQHTNVERPYVCHALFFSLTILMRESYSLVKTCVYLCKSQVCVID